MTDKYCEVCETDFQSEDEINIATRTEEGSDFIIQAAVCPDCADNAPTNWTITPPVPPTPSEIYPPNDFCEYCEQAANDCICADLMEDFIDEQIAIAESKDWEAWVEEENLK